jgi:hypothetical protein
VIFAFLILLGFAFAFVAMLVDVDRLRDEVELDELWDDEVGADGALLWASSGTVGADGLIGGAA